MSQSQMADEAMPLFIQIFIALFTCICMSMVCPCVFVRASVCVFSSNDNVNQTTSQSNFQRRRELKVSKRMRCCDFSSKQQNKLNFAMVCHTDVLHYIIQFLTNISQSIICNREKFCCSPVKSKIVQNCFKLSKIVKTFQKFPKLQ